MATGAIGSTTDSSAAISNGFASLSSDQFIKVLVTELTHQDPFQPQDSGKILEQLSSLRNIESQMSLQEKLGKLVDQSANGQQSLLESMQSLILQNQITAAGAMIGKLVQGVAMGTGGQPESVSGLVTSVRVQDGTVVLDLDTGKALPMDQVTLVTNVQTQSKEERLVTDAAEAAASASSAERVMTDEAAAPEIKVYTWWIRRDCWRCWSRRCGRRGFRGRGAAKSYRLRSGILSRC